MKSDRIVLAVWLIGSVHTFAYSQDHSLETRRASDSQRSTRHRTERPESSQREPGTMKGGDQGGRVETKWVAEVVDSGGKTAKRLGIFDTYDEAEAACQEWSKAHPDDLRLTRTREFKFRIPDTKPRRVPTPQETRPLSGPKGDPPKTSWPNGYVGEWIDGVTRARLLLEPDGTVRWTLDDPTAVQTKRSGYWRQRDDGVVEIEVDRGWLIIEGSARGGVLRGTSRNKFAPQRGTSEVELQRGKPSRPAAADTTSSAAAKSPEPPSRAPYRLKYPVNSDGRLRIELEGAFEDLDQAIQAARRRQRSTEYNVLVVDGEGNTVADP